MSKWFAPKWQGANTVETFAADPVTSRIHHARAIVPHMSPIIEIVGPA